MLHPSAWLLSAAAMAAIISPEASAQPAASGCKAPHSSAGGPINRHTRHVEANLNPAVVKAGARPYTLAARMRAYQVPGISVAVIHDGKLDWARGWGLRDSTSCAPVTPQTAFQAASISKVATSIIALRLVEQGKLSLDRDINHVLRSWQVPQAPALAADGVTLRQLLSHTAGLGVHGFAGYAPGAPLPTLPQILDGKPPANSAEVRSVLPAGAQWRYSGGGYVIAQLAMSDATGMPFEELAQRELLQPLGMTRSAYAQPPSQAIRADMALAHERLAPIPGGYHVYPELGPAGLWTTAGDLARLMIDVQASAAGRSGHRLSPAMTRQMLTPVQGNWGIGPGLQNDGARRFGHDGLNEGFMSFMVAYVDRGEGVVVLTNGGQGRRLIDEVVRAIATDYGWKDIALPTVSEQALTSAEMERVAGRFEGGGLSVTIEARPEGLFATTGGPQPERLAPLSATRFHAGERGIVVQFAPDYASFDIVEGGPPLKFTRSTPPTPAPR